MLPSLRIRFLFFILISFLFAGCDSSDKMVMPLVIKRDAPSMSARNIDVLFSDSGKVAARLISPLMNRYEGANPYMDFPEGFRIYIYDSLQRISSSITGRRGTRRENQHNMEAWGNVIVRNEQKNEQIVTEHLTWDENRHRVWSDVKVTITRPDQIITGTSMESNDTFTRYSITNMNGEMMVRRDSI